MAYVLVAVGALMAASGLYTIGYSVLNARFDEYWTALGAGATLVAGGAVTIALGVAIRALTQLKSVLAVPLRTPSVEPVSPANGSSHPAVDTAAPAITAGALEPSRTLEAEAHRGLVETEAPIVGSSPPLPISTGSVPPPQPQTSPERPTISSVPGESAPGHAAPFSPPRTAEAAAVPPAQGSFDPPPLRHDEQPSLRRDPEPHDMDLFAEDAGTANVPPDRHAIETARPADDYKLETPSTPEHDLPEIAPSRPRAIPQTPPSPEMPDDWLDRAFAALDEELPVGRPANHDSASGAVPRQDPPRLAAPDPEPAPLEPTASEPTTSPASLVERPYESDVPPPPSAPERPPSPVIGRYEADGTSYVMYADGSIEAQSSSGVYRFSSMAELKSYIEN